MNMQLTVERKIAQHLLGSAILALIFCTVLRISFLMIYPLFVVFVFYLFNWKVSRNFFYILGFAVLFWLYSMRDGVFLKYNLVSLYYFIPFILLLCATPARDEYSRDYLRLLMNALSAFAIINNLFGIYQYSQHPYDDSFQGIYGTFTVSQNGLSIINAVLFFYHITAWQHRSKKIHLWLAAFFIICAVMGFYGAGMMAFLCAVVLTTLRIRWKNIVLLIISLILLLLILYVVMRIVSPLTLDYNLNILKMFIDPAAGRTPRKLVIFNNYYIAYTRDAVDMLFGSGPGTFNSRTAFMVGSPTYFNIQFIKSDVQPLYFANYAYTLWNPGNTGPYDGFMNQPFTSLLALLGEYGLLITLAILFIWVGRYRSVVKSWSNSVKNYGLSLPFKMFKFCSVFAMLLMVIDNYMEYPEILSLLLIIATLGYQQLRSAEEDQEIGASTRDLRE